MRYSGRQALYSVKKKRKIGILRPENKGGKIRISAIKFKKIGTFTAT